MWVTIIQNICIECDIVEWLLHKDYQPVSPFLEGLFFFCIYWILDHCGLETSLVWCLTSILYCIVANVIFQNFMKLY